MSTCPLIVVTGTATEIGKTVTARGLVAAWARRGGAIAGIKPVESGVPSASDLDTGDVGELGSASTFHVKRFPPPYRFSSPVSPHLAARREGRTIEPSVIVEWAERIRAQADGVVLELPGGLFSPLTEELTNAALVPALRPTAVVLVAPDRLGVLHDVRAATLAARTVGVTLHGIVLSTPVVHDAATGTNAEELGRCVRSVPVLGVLPRAHDAELAANFDAVLDALDVIDS